MLPLQIIFFGAPGTGKSYAINALVSTRKQFRVTIHPEFTYSDFAGQLLPTNDEVGNLIFSFKPGAFTEALSYAFTHRDEEVVLILEELSRGNVAAIFGDLFQLLDRDIHTGNSIYPVHNALIASYLPEIEENIAERTPDNIFLPANLSILASVNTSDQNVVPMDTAFKRRFEWRYVGTEPLRCDSTNGKYLNDPKVCLPTKRGTVSTTWVELYQNINRYILSGNSPLGVNEDKQIGQFFISFSEGQIEGTYNGDEEAISEVNSLIINKLLMYLWEDVEGRNGLRGSGDKRLFIPEITCFGELYCRATSEQIFSDFFFSEYYNKES